MPVKVADASAVAAMLFGEPAAEEVAGRCRRSSLAAPTLLRYEVGNVCVVKLRRYPSQRDAILKAWGLIDQIDIHEIDVSFPDVIALADEVGLTAYDASYLWLAEALRVELVTLDSRLERAFRKRKIR